MRSSHFCMYSEEILSNAKNQSKDEEYVAQQCSKSHVSTRLVHEQTLRYTSAVSVFRSTDQS
ncbi:hypothetical protein BDV41DRAFT_532856 [Aspergillus transmontanensis]|uniref:Uncharacterized protein n=1 Tax=Aspergillus transmontanensis TaxID=1034304 RepID=A0A5N6W5V5_9EURO|nr:hypothetical protein BDV41DRAFT_532856 [Aspergillus transmontanensis]